VLSEALGIVHSLQNLSLEPIISGARFEVSAFPAWMTNGNWHMKLPL